MGTLSVISGAFIGPHGLVLLDIGDPRCWRVIKRKKKARKKSRKRLGEAQKNRSFFQVASRRLEKVAE